jgi:hypothetical protein
LEKRAEQVLPVSLGGWREKERLGVGWRNGPMYAQMNKGKNKKIKRRIFVFWGSYL